MTIKRGRDYFYGIDLIRFAAALLVAIFHLGYSCWASPTSGGGVFNQGAYTLPEIAHLTWFGWIGVEIFFVISGFVIATSAACGDPLRFLRSRAIRLYPAVWICSTATLIALFIFSLAKMGHLKIYLISLTLFPGGPFIDAPYWTLGLEVVFYACIFILLAAGAYRRIEVFAAILGLWSSTFLIALTFSPSLTSFTRGAYQLLLLNYGVFFTLGMMFRQILTGRMNATLWAVTLLCTIAGILEIREHAISMGMRVTKSPVNLADVWPIAATVWLIAVGGIALSIRYMKSFLSLSQGTLRILRSAGLATYPLYLLHFTIGVNLTRVLVQAGLLPVIALGATVLILVALSVLVSEILEPIMRQGFRCLLSSGAAGLSKLGLFERDGRSGSISQ